ncbi:MAG TPA: MFS transporter [Candidatus Acidoferrales bacterium]|nr:MFS transporter [Candidatus Acidoferrales bacterium]
MNTPSRNATARDTRWFTRAVLGIGLANLFSDWGHEAATALLPALLALVGAPAIALGAIEGVADGLSSFCKLAGGWIADRPRWRKPVASSGYVVVGLTTFAYSLAQSWPAVLVLRALGWAGRGGKSPSRDALLADGVAAEQLGRAFGFERAMDTVGAIAGPLTAVALVSISGVRAALRWTIVPGLLAAICFLWLVPAGKSLTAHTPFGFFHSLARLPRNFRLFLAGVFAHGIGDFAPTLLILRAGQILAPHYGATRASALAIGLYTFHNVVFAAVSYPVGALADRAGKRKILAFGYAIGALMCVGFVFAPADLKWLVILFGLAGVHMATEQATEKSLAAELVTPEIRGTGFGVLATVNGLGDFVSSLVVGALWSAVAPAAGFYFGAGFMILGAGFVYFLR